MPNILLFARRLIARNNYYWVDRNNYIGPNATSLDSFPQKLIVSKDSQWYVKMLFIEDKEYRLCFSTFAYPIIIRLRIVYCNYYDIYD